MEKPPSDIVYIQASDGTPLMPTSRKGKVRWLLKLKQAKVICLSPFTIRLLYESEKYVQRVPYSIDPIGDSAAAATADRTKPGKDVFKKQSSESKHWGYKKKRKRLKKKSGKSFYG